MAYVYKHIRLDNNDIFYIGIGSDEGYYRANSKRNRNKHWENVVNKCDYSVEIIYSGIDYNTAKKIEIELISNYKLISEGGTLVNYTKGGQGQLGLTPKNAKPVFAKNILTNIIFEFNSILEASKALKISRPNITKVINDKQRYAKDFVFSYNKNTLNSELRAIRNNNIGWRIDKVPIYITSLNNFNPIYFDSISNCVKQTNFGFQSSKISKVKNNLQKKHKNHIFSTNLNELKQKFDFINK